MGGPSRSKRRPWILPLAIALALAAAPAAAEAGSRGGSARSTRSTPRASRPAPAATQTRGGTARAARPSHGAPTGAASGTAVYGHRRGHGHWHGYGSAYLGGPYWSWGLGFYGYYPFYSPDGYYYPYGYPYVAVAPGERPAVAAVETAVSPRRAEVWVDGEYQGQARDFNGRWDRLWLAPGVHVVELRKDGYMTLRRDLRLVAGDYLRIDERLRKGEGIDPRSTKEPPPAPEEGVAREDAPATERAPAPGDGVQPAFLTFDVTPADAVVYIDGEFLARADELARLHGAIPVAVGKHVIEVVRPGYRSAKRVVEALGDAPRGVHVALEAVGGD